MNPTEEMETKTSENKDDNGTNNGGLTDEEDKMWHKLMDLVLANKTNDFERLVTKIKSNAKLNLLKTLNSQNKSKRDAITTYLIIAAAIKNNLEIVKILVNLGVDINVQDEYNTNAVWEACGNNNNEMCRFLLQHGADPNCGLGNQTTLCLAAMKGNKQIMEMLLNIDKKFKNSFDWVCSNNT